MNGHEINRYCKVCGKLIPKKVNCSWNEYKKKKYCDSKTYLTMYRHYIKGGSKYEQIRSY